MNEEELISLYNILGDNVISCLYMYSCLIHSGFNNETACEILPILNDLWLQNQSELSIPKLSDMLYDNYINEVKSVKK